MGTKSMAWRNAIRCIGIACLASLATTPSAVLAQHTVYFKTADTGETKAMTEWGADTAWPSPDNMRQCIMHMGLDEIDVVRLNFYESEPLQSDGQIGPNSKQHIDDQLAIAALCGNKPLALTPDSANPTDASYLNGNEVNVDSWVKLLAASMAYIDKPIRAIEPFNEPDYWQGQGTPQNLRDIMLQMSGDARFDGIERQGASTLNSDAAQSWFDVIAKAATHGTTHVLAGSANSYADFIEHVNESGKLAFNPELHSLAEAIYGAEYGLTGGIWWGAVQRARGLFVRACQGKRLGYAEDRSTQSAAAVYRSPKGELYAFAGCFERSGSPTPYRFVSMDRDVYFNGIGPIREFMLPVTQGQDAYADIDYGANALPPLDGGRFRIVSEATGLSLQVQDASKSDGGDIRVGVDKNASHQRWDIAGNNAGYYTLTNTNSAKTAEVADWSLDDGANIRQWGAENNFLASWFIDDAGGGRFFVRNAQTGKYMTSDGANVYQWDPDGTDKQRWLFVPAEVAVVGKLASSYAFEKNAKDSVGKLDGEVSGDPAYAAGPIGQALALDGVDDFVTLPSGVASSNDITVTAWVYWNGGDNWQRIFDFGNDTDHFMMLTPKSGDGTLRFVIKNGSVEEILDTDGLPIGKWVHLAVTLRGHTGVMYVDGKPRVAGRILQNPSAFKPMHNCLAKSEFPADPLFRGMIDEVHVFDHALDAQAVADLAGPSSGANALRLHLPFDETSGTMAADLSGNHFDGTLQHGPNWSTGAVGNAVMLDGVDDYVSLPAGAVSALRDFSVSAWVFLNTLGRGARLFDFGSGPQVNMYLAPAGSDTVARFGITTSGSAGEQRIDGKAPLPSGVWTHVVVTLAGGVGILYVDGHESGRNAALTLTPAALGLTAQNFIGKSQSKGPYLDGAVDELRVLGRALTPREVAAAFAEGKPGSDLPPTAANDHDAGLDAAGMAGRVDEADGGSLGAAGDANRENRRKSSSCTSIPGHPNGNAASGVLMALFVLGLCSRRHSMTAGVRRY